jgi:hypothetical protein
MNQPSTFPNLSCVVKKDEDTGMFVGHCLNYDLMDSGKTPQKAWENLRFVVKSHIEFCYTHHQSGLKRTATQRDWDRFFEAMQQAIESDPSCIHFEKLELDLKPPTLPEHEMGIWIQKVQCGGDFPDV